MTQIVADRRQIGSRLQKTLRQYCASCCVGEAASAEIRNIPGSTGKTPGEDVADPEPSQGRATVIQKHANFGARL